MNKLWKMSAALILLIYPIGCGMQNRPEENSQHHRNIQNVQEMPIQRRSSSPIQDFRDPGTGEKESIISNDPLHPNAEIRALDDLALERGPYLQNGTGNSVWVIWKAKQAHRGKLEYGTSESNKKTIIPKEYKSEQRVRITGLTPGKKYYYRISINGKSTQLYSFMTNKKEGDHFRMLVMGDSGIGTTAQFKMANLISRYPYDLAIHLGDIIYYKGEPQYYDSRFFNPYQRILSSAVMYTTPGNHDRAQAYYDNFVLPENGPAQVKKESVYSFDYANAHFISLNSNLRSEDLTRFVVPWLNKDLAANKKRWTFVFFHHPPFTAGKYSGTYEVENMKKIIVPVLEKYKVDLVMSGHEHFYQRTKPINGITYLINGSAGMELGQKRHNYAYVDKIYNSQHNFTAIDVKGSAVLIRTMNTNGEIVDSHWIRK